MYIHSAESLRDCATDGGGQEKRAMICIVIYTLRHITTK